jgi:fructokinase
MGLKILAFGEVLWDIIEGVPCIGGAPLNFCGHCAQMGDETYIISSVGSDNLGSDVINILKDIGVSDKFVSEVGFPTGTVPVSLEEGIPNYDIKSGSAWDYISVNETYFKKIVNTQWDVFYLGTLSQRSAENRILLDRLFDSGMKAEKVFFDINLRQNYYSEEIILKSLQRSDIVKINDEELLILKEMFHQAEMNVEDFSRFIMEKYEVELLCITYGGKGAVLYQKEEQYVLVPDKVPVVSTVGAGDSFSAGLVHGLMNTGSITKSGELALTIAGCVVSSTGALLNYQDVKVHGEDVSLFKVVDRIKGKLFCNNFPSVYSE